MKYSFSISKISKSIFYDILVEDSNYDAITLLTYDRLKPDLIQRLIDGVTSTKNSNKIYKYQTEGDDLYIYSNGYGVQFFNLKNQNKEADLVLSHDTFIDFLTDLKKFIEKN